MSRRDAEGRTCEFCRRRMLAGESFQFFDDPVHRRHRRPICALCRRQALDRGWTPTVELPGPDLPDLRIPPPDDPGEPTG